MTPASRPPSRMKMSWYCVKMSGWAARDGVPGTDDTPVTPWHAAQVAAIAGGAAWVGVAATATNQAIVVTAATREPAFTDIALTGKKRSPARGGCRGRGRLRSSAYFW